MDDEHTSHDEHRNTANGNTHAGVGRTPTRTTAPMSDFTTRQVGFGIIALVVGLVIVFAIPLLFA